jgi:hypothetical protein
MNQAAEKIERSRHYHSGQAVINEPNIFILIFCSHFQALAISACVDFSFHPRISIIFVSTGIR